MLGRFLQENVYRGDGLNLYTYCHNNPVTYCDPSGYSALEDIKAALKTDANGNKYTHNHDHDSAIKTTQLSPDDYSGVVQSHHLLQSAWANKNLKGYGYNAKDAPTITLETNRAGVTDLPHTLITSAQNSRGINSGDLQERLIMGANDAINAGVEKKVVLVELENNYKMIDKLNENNKNKPQKEQLPELTYSKKEIEDALVEEPTVSPRKCPPKTQ